MRDIAGKVAIVTGGSRGIGRAIALLLAKKGALVTICARNAEILSRTCKEIEADGNVGAFFNADVRDERQVDSMVDNVVSHMGRIDILVNNAGVGIVKPIWECNREDWDYIIDTNLRGCFFCSKAVIPIMKKQKSGYIMNISSGAGLKGFEGLALYSASKHGLIGLSEGMRKDLCKYGVEVDYICPGYVRTEFFRDGSVYSKEIRNGIEPRIVASEVVKRIMRGNRRNRKCSTLFSWCLDIIRQRG